MNTWTKRFVGIGALLAALLVVWIYARPAAGASQRECPHFADSADTALHCPDLSAPKQLTNVAEYHDCQRFIVKDANRNLIYDSLQAVYVAYDLGAVLDQARRLGRDRQDGGRGKAGKPPAPAADRGARGSTGGAFIGIIGEIRSEGAYAPLGISLGKTNPFYTCIVFKWDDPNQPTTYDAWLLSTTDETECDPDTHPNPSTVGADHLEVNVEKTVANIGPALARWEWDASDSTQYIGISCPAGWCGIHQIGHTPVVSSARTEGLDILTGVNPAVEQGAWDWQFLADYTGPPWSRKVVTTNSWAMVIPDPALGSYTTDNDYKNKWREVAHVAMSEEISSYPSKLNLRKAYSRPSGARRLNVVSLCLKTTPDDCAGSGHRKCVDDLGNVSEWRAQVATETLDRSPPAKVKFLCADFMQTFTTVATSTGTVKQAVAPPPGVVRWRWLAKDETMWVSCPAGCCQVKVQ